MSHPTLPLLVHCQNEKKEKKGRGGKEERTQKKSKLSRQLRQVCKMSLSLGIHVQVPEKREHTELPKKPSHEHHILGRNCAIPSSLTRSRNTQVLRGQHWAQVCQLLAQPSSQSGVFHSPTLSYFKYRCLCMWNCMAEGMK